MTDEHIQVKFQSESCEINYSTAFKFLSSRYKFFLRKQLSLFVCFFLPGPSIIPHGVGKICLGSL